MPSAATLVGWFTRRRLPGLAAVLRPLPEPGPTDTTFKNVLKFFTKACVAMSPHIPSPLPFLLSFLSGQEWSPRDPAMFSVEPRPCPPLSP